MSLIPLLLSDPSPILRSLVLRDLLKRDSNDEEIMELEELKLEDPLLTNLLKFQNTDGSWDSKESTGLLLDNRLRNTAQALCRLGYFGFNKKFPPVQKAAEFLFSQQLKDGSWPRYEEVDILIHKFHGKVFSPMQTAFPLRGLVMSGYATDPRAEKAYEWLLKNRAEDGSWPAYFSPDGNIGYQFVGYRQMPNSRLGCRSNSTCALSCFAYHPTRRNSIEAKKVLDLLLARDTQERRILGFEIARLIGMEQAHGYLTFYARFDLALILDLCWRIGATTQDNRVRELIDFFNKIQGPYGLWDYQLKPQATKWITFDISRSLKNISKESDWISYQPQTKYKSYPKKVKRF